MNEQPTCKYCSKPAVKRRDPNRLMCKSHEARWYRTGDPLRTDSGRVAGPYGYARGPIPGRHRPPLDAEELATLRRLIGLSVGKQP